MPLIQKEKEESYVRPNYFKYIKGEIHLVLVKDEEKPKWIYRQDLQDKTPILRSKIYTFGNRYGILFKKENSNSRLNVHGIEWKLKTRKNGTPILVEPNVRTPKLLELYEVY